MMSSGTRRFLRVVGAAFVDRGDTKDGAQQARVLIVRRPPGDTGAGLWEFPGGKIEVGETAEEALHREIEEELGVRARVLGDLGEILHSYDTADIELRVFVCGDLSGTLELREHDAMEWRPVDTLDQADLLAADKPFVRRLREWLEANRWTP